MNEKLQIRTRPGDLEIGDELWYQLPNGEKALFKIDNFRDSQTAVIKVVEGDYQEEIACNPVLLAKVRQRIIETEGA